MEFIKKLACLFAAVCSMKFQNSHIIACIPHVWIFEKWIKLLVSQNSSTVSRLLRQAESHLPANYQKWWQGSLSWACTPLRTTYRRDDAWTLEENCKFRSCNETRPLQNVASITKPFVLKNYFFSYALRRTGNHRRCASWLPVRRSAYKKNTLDMAMCRNLGSPPAAVQALFVWLTLKIWALLGPYLLQANHIVLRVHNWVSSDDPENVWHCHAKCSEQLSCCNVRGVRLSSYFTSPFTVHDIGKSRRFMLIAVQKLLEFHSAPAFTKLMPHLSKTDMRWIPHCATALVMLPTPLPYLWPTPHHLPLEIA